MIPISLPSTDDSEWLALKGPIESGWLTSGPEVRAFEEAFAKRHHVRHAIAVTSATTALHLSLIALDVGPDDEVIVPALSWIATANAVRHTGAEVVFCDVEDDSYNLDTTKLEHLIGKKTKAIIPVHLFGLCMDIDRLKHIAQDIPIIEDAACAAGSSLRQRPAGSLGTLGCFSFHPRKIITTGEGGMVTTNSDTLAQAIYKLRNHGAEISEEQRHQDSRPFALPDFNLLGYNYRMSDLQGAVGKVQLTKLDRFIEERRWGASFYHQQLADIPWLRVPTIFPDVQPNWQSYVTMINPDKSPGSRDEILSALLERGISARPGTHAIHIQNYYQRRYNLKPQDFPVAQSIHKHSMALPIHNRMTHQDYQHVASCLKDL